MYFESTTVAQYPRCNAFIMTELSPKKLKDARPKVWKAFIRACNNEDIARNALTYATEPLLGVAVGEIPLPGGGTALGLHSEFLGSHQITISNLRLEPFEFSVRGSIDMLKNAERLEATILHELVHWVRFEVGISPGHIDDSEAFNPGEAGLSFEMWAYGRITSTRAEVSEALFSYPT